MSLQASSCLASAHHDIDPAERPMFETEAETLPQHVTESEENPGTDEDAVMADKSDSPEGRASSKGPEDSTSDDEDTSGDGGESGDTYDDAEDADGEDSDGDSGDDGGDDGDDDRECTDAEHCHEENCHEQHCHNDHTADEQCKEMHCSEYHYDEAHCGEEYCQKGHDDDEHSHHGHCKGEHRHEKSGEAGIDVNEREKLMGTGKPAAGIHECSGHNHDNPHAKKRVARLVDGRELFFVLLTVHFNDALIDYSRRYGSKFCITGDADSSALPELLDFERARTLLEDKFAGLAAHVDHLDRSMPLLKSRPSLRYRVKLKFIAGQVGVPNMPHNEFMGFGTMPISGEEALALIARMDEIVLDAIELVDDVVTDQDTASYRLRNGLRDSSIEHVTSAKEPLEAVEGPTAGRDGGSGAANIGDGIRHLNFGDGQPLFSVYFDIRFIDALKNYSRIFRSNSRESKDPNATSELCDLDFKHLQRLINIPLNGIANDRLFEKEKDLTAEQRKERVRCAIRVDFSTGLDRSERKRYMVYMASALSRGTGKAIKEASESCISTAIKTIDAISAQRQVARREAQYDPCAFIPDFEVRQAVAKEERNDLERSRLRKMIRDAYDHMSKRAAQTPDAAAPSGRSCGGESRGADGHAHDHAPGIAPDSRR